MILILLNSTNLFLKFFNKKYKLKIFGIRDGNPLGMGARAVGGSGAARCQGDRGRQADVSIEY